MIVAGIFAAAGKIPLRLPYAARQAAPRFGGKLAVQPRRAVECRERGFNGDRAAAAEGVAEIAAAAVARNVHDGGGERFAQRSRDLRRAVAALMEPRAARIDIERGLVLHNGELDGEALALFGEPRETVHALEPFDNGLFHDFLAVRHGVERALKRPALDGERAVRGDESLPRQCAHALEELVEGARREPAEDDQNALGKARADVRARDGALVAGEVYAPVFRRNIFHIHMAQLVAERTFQPEQTRRAESEFHVISSDVISIRKDSTLFRSKLQAI